MRLLAITAALFAIVAACFANASARAEWKDKNTQINQTNFIILDKDSHSPICSATLVSLKYKLIITAHHCIDDFIELQEREEAAPDGAVKKVKREALSDVTVAQKSYQGHRLVGDLSLQAVIVAHNKKADLALLQLRAESIPQTLFAPLLPASKTVQRGDRVWVVGNPLGILDASLTSGIVSSTTRMYRTPWADDQEVPFLQTDAAINGGNSGGALYNDDGEFIGVPDAGWRGANGLGLTLTPESVRAFLKENCWEELYKADAESHDACSARKKDEENKRREKAGLPPLTE